MQDTQDSGTRKDLIYYIRFYLDINRQTIQGKLTVGFLSLGGLAIFLVTITNYQWRSAIQQSKYALSTAANSRMYSTQLQYGYEGAVTQWHRSHILQEPVSPAEVTMLEQRIRSLQDTLLAFSKEWKTTPEQKQLADVVQQYSALQAIIHQQPDSLAAAQQLYNNQIQPRLTSIQRALQQLIVHQNAEVTQAHSEIVSVEERLRWLVPGYVVLAFSVAYLIGFYIIVRVLRRIRYLKSYLRELSKGNLPEPIPASPDEMNTLIKEINILTDNLREIKDFALYVGKGDFDKNISIFDDKGDLGISLSQMREELKKVSSEEKKRFWANEGFAHFSDILRSSHNLTQLADKLIQQLVKYLHVNQGGLFIIENEGTPEACLELKACYAYNRKKYIEKKIYPGQGLLGQTWLEGETTYLRVIPEDYLRITSGLGEANPRYLLLIPLKVEDKVEGVIELASFKDFEKHEISFAEKVAESVASTFVNARVVEQTNRLLKRSQEMGEEMKAQEEEMRQNVEELSSTQEEMQRVLKETQAKEEYLWSVLDTATDSIYTVDRQYQLISFNHAAQKNFEKAGFWLNKGVDMLAVAKERETVKNYYDRALAGEKFEVTDVMNFSGRLVHLLVSYAPIQSATGQIYAVAIYAKDITAITDAREEVEQLLAESQAKTDVLLDIQQEAARQRAAMDTLLNYADYASATIDRDYCILAINNRMKKFYAAYGIRLEPGTQVLNAYQTYFGEAEGVRRKAWYDKAFAGEAHTIEEELVLGDKIIYLEVNHKPIKDEDGHITAIAVSGRDISVHKSEQRILAETLKTVQDDKEKLAQEIEELKARLASHSQQSMHDNT